MKFYMYIVCSLLFKVIAEFSRIMGKDMQAAYNAAWSTLMQNVLKVAAMETNNIPVQSALKLAGQNPSDGERYTYRKAFIIYYQQCVCVCACAYMHVHACVRACMRQDQEDWP